MVTLGTLFRNAPKKAKDIWPEVLLARPELAGKNGPMRPLTDYISLRRADVREKLKTYWQKLKENGNPLQKRIATTLLLDYDKKLRAIRNPLPADENLWEAWIEKWEPKVLAKESQIQKKGAKKRRHDDDDDDDDDDHDDDDDDDDEVVM